MNRRVSSTDPTGEAELLSDYSSSVPLIGRQAVLGDLWSWMKNGRPISVRVLTARAGTGKTRLALELCDQAVDVGWAAGFLSEIPEPGASRGWAGPTLVVVDYAASRARLLRKWLIELADHLEQKGSPLRLLLLERQAWMNVMIGVYRRAAQAADQEPDSKLLAPILEQLGAGQDSAST